MNQAPTNNPVPILKGEKYRRGHKASVIGVLGADFRPVRSRGSQFYNRDRWTARALIREMCRWAKENPGCVPTVHDVDKWVTTSNNERVDAPEIVIANTPDELPLRVALALTGGAYHEAFHTLYSCRRNLNLDGVVPIILPRWAKVQDWSKYHNTLQQMSNVIEDIRIERRGREDFEGAYVKLCDLQDFILHQEAKYDEKDKATGGSVGALSIVIRTYRDVGLGYPTEKQRVALEQYKTLHPDAVALVLEGPLAAPLRENIDLDSKDDLGCVRIALDVMAELAKLGGRDKEENKSESGKMACPKCGAVAGKLKVRPKSDGRGGKVRGVGILTCTVCGFQTEVPIQPKSAAEMEQEEQEQEEGPQFEDFDDKDEPQDGKAKGKGKGKDGEEDKDASGGGKGKQDKKDGKDSKGKGKDGKGKDGDEKKDAGGGSKKDEDGDTDGDEGDTDGADGDKDGKGKGKNDKNANDGEDGDDAEGAGDEDGEGENADGSGENNDTDGSGSDITDGDHETPDSLSAKGAGGHDYDDAEHPGNDWSGVADEALTQAEEGKDTGITDGNEALEQAFGEAKADEDKDVKKDEAAWNPYDPELDEAILVRPSKMGRDYDTQQTENILHSVRSETSYLRARIRNILRAMEMTYKIHGVPKGRGLSNRYLVDSKVALLGKEFPNRAYWQMDDQLDVSMAVAVVLDESISMRGELRDATRILCALTDPFDALHYPTLALGFRNGRGPSYSAPSGEKGDYHRYNGTIYDIFKMWHEKFNAVKYRFANTRAEGGTPMSDGVQYALDALSQRNEAHRFMFIVTDGQPDYNHTPIINRQIRLAKQAGIHIVGVGLGCGATYVKTLFPDHVWSVKLSEIPRLLVAKLNELADLSGHNRGKRVQKTG